VAVSFSSASCVINIETLNPMTSVPTTPSPRLETSTPASAGMDTEPSVAALT
jgi:hypothetical protein